MHFAVAVRFSLLLLIAFAISCAEGLPSNPSMAMGEPDGSLDASPGGGTMDSGKPDTGTGGTGGAAAMDAAVDSGPGECADGEKNGLETDTDCGGPDCDPCVGGDNCVEGTDCASGTCEPDASVCAEPEMDSGMSGDPCTSLTMPGATCTCSVYNTKAYFFCTDKKDWNAARTACMGATLDLVTIDDMAEQSFLATSVTQNTWIGATIATAPSVIWIATGMEFWNTMAVGGAFANWAPGFPVAVASWCGYMQGISDKKWATGLCTLPYAYICEQK